MTLDVSGLKKGTEQAKQMMENLRRANMKMRDAKLGIGQAMGLPTWSGDMRTAAQTLDHLKKRLLDLQRPAQEYKRYMQLGSPSLAKEHLAGARQNVESIRKTKEQLQQLENTLRIYAKTKANANRLERESMEARGAIKGAMPRVNLDYKKLIEHQTGIAQGRSPMALYYQKMVDDELRRQRTARPPLLPMAQRYRQPQSFLQRMMNPMVAQRMIGAVAGGFAGGGIGSMAGALMGPWGAVIGTGIDMAISGFKRLFSAIKEGLMDAAAFASRTRAFQAQSGMTAKASSQLFKMAEFAGVDPNAVALEWGRFQANLTNIAKTSPQVSAALFSLGISLGEMRQLTPDQQFEKIAGALADVKNSSNASAAALALFNRHGVELLRLFRDPMTLQLYAKTFSKAATALAANNGKLRDQMSFFDRMMNQGVSAQKQSFFVGMWESIGDVLTKLAQSLADVDWMALGKAAGTSLKPLVQDMVLITNALAKLSEVAGKAAPVIGFLGQAMMKSMIKLAAGPFSGLVTLWEGIKGFLPESWFKPQDVPPLANTSTGGARLFDPMNFYGKGPGDSWSKIGAYSIKGGMNPVGVGIGIQQTIANNTRDTVVWLKRIADANKPITLSGSGPSNPLASWDAFSTVSLNSPYVPPGTTPSLNSGYLTVP